MHKHALLALGAAVATSLIVVASAFAAAPSNSTAPAVTGTAKVGQTLTVSNGTWTGSPTNYTYQWQRCTSTSSCTNIANATSKTYVVATADQGKTLRAVVTAANADGLSTANSNMTSTVAAATGLPANTAQPSISGTAIVGDVLVADPGTWSNAPTSYSYRWFQCGRFGSSCIDTGFTGRRYVVQLADVGGTLRVAVTARNASGSATVRSEPSDVVEAQAVVTTPTPDKAPTITFISAVKRGTSATIRFRLCDDAPKAVEVLERTSKPGYLSYARKYAVTPNACLTATRTFTIIPRFRTKGRFVISLTAIDKSGKASRTVSRSVLYK